MVNNKKSRELGFEKAGDIWDSKDDQYLIKNYKYVTCENLAQRFNRSPNGVNMHFYVLKQRGAVPKDASLRFDKDKVSVKDFKDLPPVSYVKGKERAVKSVPRALINKDELNVFVHSNHLKYRERWSPAEREILKRMKNANIRSNEIAKKLGRTVDSVDKKYQNMLKEDLKNVGHKQNNDKSFVNENTNNTPLSHEHHTKLGLFARFSKLLKGNQESIITATNEILDVSPRAPPVFVSQSK
jgi:DNA-binding CsgD family transcriptional regulator